MVSGDKLREECGVFGAFSGKTGSLAELVYLGLFALQHRGQESCGIVVNNGGAYKSCKDLGLVSDVFNARNLGELGEGNMALGHVRYGTTGANIRANVQPIEVHRLNGNLAVAHNGNLTNSEQLRQYLELQGSIFHSTSDTEVIAYLLTKERLTSPDIESAISSTMEKIRGAYSLVIMTGGKMIAVRDPQGYRPLCYGVIDGPEQTYVIASETCALDVVGARFIRDIEPGEILSFSKEGVKSIKTHCQKEKKSLCVFEYIYFARPDSVIDGISVHQSRVKAGRILAKEHPVEADVVIGVPDSGLDAALGYSEESGIPYGMGFVKNKYIGRTFINPGQTERQNKVKIKLNPIAETVRDKRVVLIDDSIVRGTTSGRIVQLVRDAGAKEVHVRISSPPFISPCFYGTDVPDCQHLIACNHSLEEIAGIIGADSLGYLSMEGALSLGKDDGLCCKCFHP
ncbi:MAG: amidophosphoribosyltransferase [Treponemataceae bacterium]|nr:amidophosphoribosyltransferase [Treponemataceae bacterium]